MIPNIVKGKGITGALAYAMGQGNDPITSERLKLKDGEQSRAEILGGQNFGFEIDSEDRLDLARRMMEWQGLPENQASKTRKLERDCFHASLSWEPGQEPTHADMLEAGRDFLKAVGLEKARAVFIAHNDTDHRHMHIIASRIDPETGRSLTLDNDYIYGQAWAAEWERAHGQVRANGQLHGLIDAVKNRDAGAVLSHLTRDKATFQPWEVNRALAYAGMRGEEAMKFRGEILDQPNVVGLRETAEDPVTRYTTRDVLASEMALQRNAGALACDESHGLDPRHAERASAAYTLKPEQDSALRHLTGAEGFSILWGEAGTGKSHTLKATRAAYEAAGKNVIGLAWTNDVAQQMRGDGFSQASTITSELFALDKGRTQWSRNTVVIVDEAAMVSTDNLARVAGAAKRSGAKLILAGDDKQLSSIERGGMFETLRQSHGAAILKEVQRVKDAEQKAAFGTMHEGDYLQALKTFEKRGGIHWSRGQGDTLREMAERYTTDVAAAPEKRRFMFAYTNADVASLNQYARALHRQRGDLGEDHALMTAHGEAQFAVGDRVQFTGNARTKEERRAGLINGRVGTVTGIAVGDDNKARMAIELDTAHGAKPKHIEITVGDDAAAGEFNSLKHGYAGTIYRGQGKTLDEVYVGHSKHWRSSAAYVALTRHRESVHIFAARETVKDLETMARSMARTENKRAATAYHADAAQLVGLEDAISAINDCQPTIAMRSPIDERSRPTAEASIAARGTTDEGVDVGSGVGRLADGIADLAGRAIESLADGLESLLGGGSSAPPPSHEPRPTPTAREAFNAEIDAFLQAERQQRAASMQEIARSIGASDAMTPEELQREQEAQAKRSRDRGGGQSL